MTNRFGSDTLDTTNQNWQLTDSDDIQIIDDYNNEHLAIGGAVINVFKLLGVHEQGQLVDLAGNGIAISGGTAIGFSASDAFFSEDNPCTKNKFWRSKQQGSTEIISKAFIGYNFGVPKLDNGRNRYGVDVGILQHITTIRITQSDNPARRSLKLRVERSEDGELWKGVDIIELQDTADEQQVSFRQSAPSRYWRLRPIRFAGGDTDFWEVKSIELIDWDQSDLFQVQDDYGWIENRDRDYAKQSIRIKGFYDLFEKETDLTPIGFTVSGGMFYITANFNDIVNRIGRPIVIGDVLEIPSEVQYDPDMNPIKKYIEVTDVSWSAEGYAPGWQPTMVRLIAEPMVAKQETMDIVGDFAGMVDQSGLLELNDSTYSKIGKQSDKVHAKSEQDVPLRGSDASEYKMFEQDEIDRYAQANIDVSKLNQNQTSLYVEDAIPPNGIEYTEGPEFPKNPKDKDYHRMTYVGMADNIPARLYRYAAVKDRWIYLETDLRSKYDPVKPSLQKLKNSKTAISSRKIGKTQK